MWNRTSQVLEGSMRAMLAIVFCAVLLVLALCFAAVTEAQETTAEQTKDVTNVKKTNEATAETATRDEDAVAQNRDMSSDESEQAVQQSAQQAQATEDDDSQTATRAATTRANGPLANEPARITESSNDSDASVANRIVIPNVDCQVGEGATVTVRDEDGTQVRLTDGDNVNITARQNQIVIVGTGTEGNLSGVNANGDFGPSNSTETGRVVGSTGITCDRDDGGSGNGGGGNGGGGNGGGQNGSDDGNCQGARVVETISGTGDQQSPPFAIVGNTFKVTYEVSATDPQLFIFDITVNEENGDFVTSIDTEQEGTRSSFVNAGAGTYFLDITALGADYTVTVEDCRETGVLNEPEGELPETGGVPVSALAGCVALLLTGTAVIGAVVGRRR